MTDRLEPKVQAAVNALLQSAPPASTDPMQFFGARFDAGLAWAHLPETCGGLGVSPEQHTAANEVLDAAGAPTNYPLNPIGLGMVAPTIAHHGTDEQRRKHLRRIFTTEDVWCQLFSEPGAGSDLASLSTLAVRDGDTWVVNGQKVWTSLGHKAAFGLLLARTDIDAPKNRGLSMFLVDMRAAGVTVAPLRQMTGDAEFNEVFLDDVRIPARDQLGEEGRGWQVATTTLMNERVSIGRVMAVLSTPADRAVELFRGHGHTDRVLRDRVTRMWMESQIGRLITERAGQLGQVGDPGPVGSIGKLHGAEHALRVHNLIMDLLGAEALLYPDLGPSGAPSERTPQVAFLRSRANTIEGGTSEVMRNILAERVLGLPRDDHGPRDQPWKDILRS